MALLPPDPELIDAGTHLASDRKERGDPGAADWSSSIDMGRYAFLRAKGMPHHTALYEVRTWLRERLGSDPLPHEPGDAGQHGALRVDGYEVIDEDGQAWFYAGGDRYVLAKRFAENQHAELLDEPIALGMNTAIVYGMFGGDGWSERYTPDTDPDFYRRLPDLAAWVIGHRCRLEYVVFTGDWLMPDAVRREDHYARVLDVLRPFAPMLIIRLMNEENGIDYRMYRKPVGFLSTVGQSNNGASGQPSFGIPPLPGWDLHCYETTRRNVETAIRDSGGGMRELIRGWPGFPGVQGPAYIGEPIGFNAVAEPGRRLNDPRIALAMGVNAGGNCLGIAFHSSEWIVCAKTSSPIVRQCAEAMYRGLYAGFVR